MGWDEELIQRVWEQARAFHGRDASQWRQDQCGAWLHRDHYDRGDSEFGWRILDTQPGPSDSPEGLAAFHVGNGFDVASGHPKCRVSADRTGLAPEQRVGEPRNKHD
jgi:hypothetical protein